MKIPQQLNLRDMREVQVVALEQLHVLLERGRLEHFHLFHLLVTVDLVREERRYSDRVGLALFLQQIRPEAAKRKCHVFKIIMFR
jgi:hypothetical protein